MVPKTIPYAQKSIVAGQPILATPVPIPAPAPIRTSIPVSTPIPVAQPQIIPRPAPIVQTNVVKPTVPVPTIASLPVQSFISPQLTQQAIRPITQFGMNTPGVYNASTYKVGFSRMNAHPGLIGGYRTNSTTSAGTVGNMNLPGQYTTKTYNARKL